MKNSKQEAIEKAYHELGFTGLYNQADSNGWVNVKPQQFTEDIFDRLKFNSNKHSIRPKSLKGIETNNGWIRIESEEDLPKKEGEYSIITIKGQHIGTANFTGTEISKQIWLNAYTHFRVIENIKRPIY